MIWGFVFKEVQPLRAMINCQAKQTEAKDKAENEHQGHTRGRDRAGKVETGEVRLVKHTKCHLHGTVPIHFVGCCFGRGHGLSTAQSSHY
jgi:hypothetical protein